MNTLVGTTQKGAAARVDRYSKNLQERVQSGPNVRIENLDVGNVELWVYMQILVVIARMITGKERK